MSKVRKIIAVMICLSMLIAVIPVSFGAENNMASSGTEAGLFLAEEILGSVKASGKSYTVTADVKNGTNGTLIAAIYKNSALVSVKSQQYTGETVDFQFTLEQEPDKVKLMLWDGLASMGVLSGTLEIGKDAWNGEQTMAPTLSPLPTPTPTIAPTPTPSCVTPLPTPVIPTATPTANPTEKRWDFSVFSGDQAVQAEEKMQTDYNGLEMHLAAGDAITADGLFWGAPGGTTSDNKTTVSNNRYIVYKPEKDGTLDITFRGSLSASNKKPRLYVSCGETLDCTVKDSPTNQMKDASGANTDAILTAEVTGGKTYYIWAYYYNDSKCTFTLSDIVYKEAQVEMSTRNIYGSNMLLQRDKPVYIDGKCTTAVKTATASLVLEATSQTVQTKAVTIEQKDWNVTFDPVSDYTNTYKIIIHADGIEDIVYENIIFGDQYLFSGQSNMWKQVSYYKNIDKDAYGTDAVADHATDKIRVMYTKGNGCYGETDLCYDAQHNEDWRDFSTYDKVKDLPAVAYTAAVKMHEETKVPIGVIANAYPGSYISSWFPNTGIDACNANKNGTANERNWYNGRIYPIRNLNLSGIFWYQGEADASDKYHANQYEYYSEMMTKLIDDWRELFRDDTLPFYYVQLCRIITTVDENNPDTGSSGKLPIKRAQTDVYLNKADKTKVGVVGTLDIYGKYQFPNTANDANCRNDIHPGQKQVIGERLAAYALKDIYGKDVYTHGPMYQSSKVEGNKIIVTYDCNGSLKIMPSTQYADEAGMQKIESGEYDPNVLNEFEVAGSDGVWYSAAAQITASNQVTVFSERVENPVSVRYACTDYPESPNLTDDSNLPSYVFMKEAVREQPTASPTTAPTTAPTTSPSITPTIEPTTTPGIVQTYQFDFGNATPAAGYKAVTPDMVYDMSDTSGDFQYGFLGTTEESYAKDILPYDFDHRAIDGFSLVKGQYIPLSAGGEDSTTNPDTDFIKVPEKAAYQPSNASEFDGRYPIRFSMKAERKSYYTVTVTLKNASSTEEACVSLFSEKRQIVAEDVVLPPAGDVTFKFNVDIEDVTYKLYNSQKFEDDMLNIAVSGKNAAISSMTVEKHGKVDGTIKGNPVSEGVNNGVTLWACTDSTGCDCAATVPFFALQNYAGVAQALVKYAPENIAISNQGERGLATGDEAHFSMCQIKPGDYLYVEYGHNESGTDSYYNNLQKYYDRATQSGASLIIVSPVNRHNNWSGDAWHSDFTGYIEKAKQFTQEKIDAGAENIAFVDMNTLYVQWMNEETARIRSINPALSADNAMSYYYRSVKGSSVDGTHMNDAGADQAAYYFFEAAKQIVEAADSGNADEYILKQAAVVRPLVENRKTTVGDTDIANKPMQVSDEIILAGPAPNTYWDTVASASFDYKNSIAIDSVDTVINPDSSVTVSSIGIRLMNQIETYAKAVVTVTDAQGSKTQYYTENNYDCTGDMAGTVKTNTGFITSDKDHNMVNEEDKAAVITIPQGATATVQILSCDDRWVVGENPVKYSAVYPVPVVEKTVFDQDGSSMDGWTYLGAVADHKEEVKDDTDGSKYLSIYSSGVDSSGNKKNYSFYKPLDENITSGKYTLSYRMRYGAGVLRFALANSIGNASNPLAEKMYTMIIDSGKVYASNTDQSIPTLVNEEGNPEGKIHANEWINVDCIIDIDNGKEYISVAGSEYAEFDISSLQQNTTAVLPLRYFAIVGDTQGAATYGDVKDIRIQKIASGELPQRTVTVHINDEAYGHVTINGEQADRKTMDISSAVTLKAVAENENYEFVNWTDSEGGELSVASTYDIQRLYNDVTVTANFRKLEENEPKTTKWDFSAYSAENAVSASEAYDGEYNGLGLHINANDTITDSGLYWSAPGGTASDAKTTVTNNRYITFTPEKSGTLVINYTATNPVSKKPGRMYVSCGDSLACTTKDSNASQKEPNQSVDATTANKLTTLTVNVTAGNTYYIWGYVYNSTACGFNILDISYTPDEV